jgi:hypothetical protein
MQENKTTIENGASATRGASEICAREGRNKRQAAAEPCLRQAGLAENCFGVTR